jgi:hypothetical protein
MSDTPREPKSSRTVWPWFAGLALVILAAAVAFWLIIIYPAQQAARGMKSSLAQALQTITGQKINFQSSTATLEKSDLAELNVTSRRTQTVVKFESTLLGSKNTLILKGDFEVKAGFDLQKPFSVHFDEATGTITPFFPPAKITSVTLKNYEVYFSDDGVINKLKPEHQELATQQLLLQARLDADKSDIKKEAEAQLRQRLQDLLQHSGLRKINDASPLPAP